MLRAPASGSRPGAREECCFPMEWAARRSLAQAALPGPGDRSIVSRSRASSRCAAGRASSTRATDRAERATAPAGPHPAAVRASRRRRPAWSSRLGPSAARSGPLLLVSERLGCAMACRSRQRLPARAAAPRAWPASTRPPSASRRRERSAQPRPRFSFALVMAGRLAPAVATRRGGARVRSPCEHARTPRLLPGIISHPRWQGPPLPGRAASGPHEIQARRCSMPGTDRRGGRATAGSRPEPTRGGRDGADPAGVAQGSAPCGSSRMARKPCRWREESSARPVEITPSARVETLAESARAPGTDAQAHRCMAPPSPPVGRCWPPSDGPLPRADARSRSPPGSTSKPDSSTPLPSRWDRQQR
jgi:hypothetical protein